MRISVFGCGYLGAVHAACMAHLGHEVVGIDVLASHVAALSKGEAPFYEPGLPELLREGVESGRLTFSTDAAAAAGAEVHFVCVGTPQKQGENAADLRYVYAAVEDLLPHLSSGDVVVGKSTVPVGTAELLADRIGESAPESTLIWNPEFLREGKAVQDTLHPDRLVYGLPEDGAQAEQKLDAVYATALSADTPKITTDLATAQLVKVAANSFLATKISFINAMAELCEVAGADVTLLADAIGLDERIGRRFLNAGIGFGGGCLPKDIRAFTARAEELGRGASVAFLKEVDNINLRRRERMVELVVEALGGQVHLKKIAVLGLAFKPDSDDVRDSPALDVAVRLHGLGAKVIATDPAAIPNSIRLHPQLGFATDTLDALHEADAVVLVTEWREYRELDPDETGRLVRQKLVIDGRNVLEPARWREAGWTYRGMGRP
jgi:UDPglucose 6-dehydrogenase